MEEEQKFSSAEYKFNRKDWLASTTTFSLQALECFYDIDYHNPDRLYEFKNEGFILLPKHQRMLDIMLESLLLRHTLHRNASYVMKSTLPKWMEYLGGIAIKRTKEILKSSNNDREFIKREIQEAKEKRIHIEGLISKLLLNREIVIIHPEGERNYKKNVHIPQANLDRLIRIQEKAGFEVPFIPLDIDYKTEGFFEPEVDLIVGRPIRTRSADELRAHLSREIKLIS